MLISEQHSEHNNYEQYWPLISAINLCKIIFVKNLIIIIINLFMCDFQFNRNYNMIILQQNVCIKLLLFHKIEGSWMLMFYDLYINVHN
jgi:hypothetical protein